MEGSQRVGLGGGWREALPLLGISLILGTPQVLALPSPFASDGLSLALSSLLPVVSLAGLFGASVAAAKGGGGCRERLVACAGFAATAIYLALSWWVILSWSWGVAVPALLLALAGSLLAVSCRSHRLGAAKGDGDKSDSPLTGVLSPRESEALHLRLDGLSSSEAAGKMGVSASTVRNLQARALDKLGVGSLDELRAGGASDLGDCNPERASLGIAVPILLAVLIGAVFVAFSRTQKTWADAVSETMVLGISLSLCSLLRGAGWDERVPLVWYEFGACAFVGFLAGLVPLVSLAAALLALVVMVGERGGEHLDSFSGLFVAFGLGVCVGGYASGLLPRLPALLALASNNEGAMLLAVLTGAVAGALCLVGVTSCVLALRSVADQFATPAEEADGGQGIRRFSAYLVSKGLNPTEVDVARLVLQGLARPEIASRLNLSRGAVNSARRGAYRKLGIHSRTELAEILKDLAS